MNLYETYKQLSQPLPIEAINKFSKEDLGLEYDIISHNYQYAINRMNEVLGCHSWIVEEDEIKEFKNGDSWEVSKRITVKIGNYIPEDETKSSRFQIEACKWNYGGGTSKLLADAHKSAITNGLKKVLAMFGVGKETYEISLDVDVIGNATGEITKEVKDLKKNILTCKDIQSLEKYKPAIQNSKFSIKEKTIIINTYNTKLNQLVKTK